ncbi:MAG: DUF1343 domain-containing protein [bacterium]|nr:DUF1343 domain-containing protein [bacterium]
MVIVLSVLIALLSQVPGSGGLPPRPAVKTGLDVLVETGFRPLRGRRVGLVCNQSSINSRGVHIISLFREQKGFELKALFSPEHGLWGNADEKVPSGIDSRTGLKFYSLYGETLRPTPEALEGIDTLVFDIQDIGARFYTYISTMAMCMEEAARQGIRFVVLDRPNPISGRYVGGPVLDKTYEGRFISYFPMPAAHGMTVGELARMFNREFGVRCDLTVIKMQGWRRRMWFDETALPWRSPSPNMRNLAAAALYPGFGIVEQTNMSVGRGTIAPFELYGAPWLDGEKLAEELNQENLPGLQFVPVEFTPDASRFAGERCSGVRVVVTDRNQLDVVRAGMLFAETIYRLYGDTFAVEAIGPMIGDPAAARKIKEGVAADEIIAAWRPRFRQFLRQRQRYLLYP